MNKLSSELRLTDGGYHRKCLVGEVNKRLNQIGQRGRSAKILAKYTSRLLQFTLLERNKTTRNYSTLIKNKVDLFYYLALIRATLQCK